MSFILDALKKSEHKRRSESGCNPRTIYESEPHKGGRKRAWGLGVLILLGFNVALLFWFFNPSQQPHPMPLNVAPVTAISVESATNQIAPTAMPNNTATISAVTENRQPVVKVLPVLRNENHIYHFGQLPPSIQKKIPVLQMTLHAYNRTDTAASMVQINDKFMREGELAADNVHLEQIVAGGVVLRYDGYRFLLPRRGN